MLYQNNKKYLNINEWVGVLNKLYSKYNIRVQARDVHQLFHHYGLKPIKTNSKRERSANSNITWFSESSFNTIRYREDFMKVLYNIVTFGDARGKESVIPKQQENISAPISYKNDENNMEKYSQHLEKEYQIENSIKNMKKKIVISENAFKRLFENAFDEGIEWKSDNNGNINFSINSKQSDFDNKDVDTRIFGTKHDVLHGDKTLGGANKSLSDSFASAQDRQKMYQEFINFAQNGFQGEVPSHPKQLDKTISKYIENNDTDGMIAWAETRIGNAQSMLDANMFTANKANSLENDTDKMARYKKMKVNGTNVDVIALYVMNDFNFSDALKNGHMRQNGTTDKLLGIKDTEREREQGFGNTPYKKIPVTYDDGQEFNLKSNFSLDLPHNQSNRDHFKQNFQTKEEYNSIKQFLDKSIIYAKYALNEESFKPDYIVAAPSSSKFNKYYCINLSNKLGVPFVDDFFKRNLINVQFDENLLKQKPLSELEEQFIKQKIQTAMFGEIASEIRKPIDFFIKNNWEVFSKIRFQKSGRKLVEESLILDILYKYVYDALSKMQINDPSNVYLTLLNKASSFRQKKYDQPGAKKGDVTIMGYVNKQIFDIIDKKRGMKKMFMQVLEEMQSILIYHTKNIEQGFKIDATKFKITHLQQRFRAYLSNVYVIADEALNKDKNLLTRYQNAKYLIFDEDINSGATLKLVIDALLDKTFGNENNIMCLVNAYSASGF